MLQRRKSKEIIAIDETLVKANKKRYYVYAAIDVERNELIMMRVYTTRNYLINRPRFVVDKASWLIDALKSLNLEHEGFSREEA